nr:MAG TPA: hypothetical protein [Caudoviricetes sp.]
MLSYSDWFLFLIEIQRCISKKILQDYITMEYYYKK